jgi:hypothetical protein
MSETNDCKPERRYAPSPKHCEPITAEKPGIKCPKWSPGIAQELLDESEPMGDGGKRVATRDGVAFIGVATNDGTWHGYPESWDMIDDGIRKRWESEGKIRKRDVRRYKGREQLRSTYGGRLP